MSRDWREFYNNLRKPITVDNTVAPADVISPGHVATGTPELDHLERDARIAAALEVVHAVLREEHDKQEGFRNVDRYDLALEIRSALLPSSPGSEVLHEKPLLRAMNPGVGSFRGYVQ